MSDRPPLPLRWETHLVSGLVSLLLAVASTSSSARRQPDAASMPPALRSHWEAGAAARARAPWRHRFALEERVVRGLAALLLAWRSYHLEHGAQRR